MDRHHVQTVIKISAEPVRGDLGRQVFVGRRQQPGLKRERAGRTDRQDFLVLDRPQQLGLGRPVQLADLVEKDRPAPGRDEQAGVVAIGPGERASNVAEELVFEQVVGDGRAVDRQKHLVAGRPQRVKRARDQLLAGPRLTRDQHRGPGRSDLADQGLDGLDRRALADERIEIALGVQLASQRLVFLEQPPKTDQAADLGEQVLEEHGLHQVVVSPALKCGDGIFDRRIGRDHDEQRFRPDLEHAMQDGDSVGSGKLDVAEYDLRLERFDLRKGRIQVAGGRDVKALALKELFERGGDHLFVVHDQDSALWHEPLGGLGFKSPLARGDRFHGISAPALAAVARTGVDSDSIDRTGRSPDRTSEESTERLMRSLGLRRQPNKECRSLAGLGPEGQSAGMIFEDLSAHEQPQARAVGLGREEGLEQPATVGDRNASTVVGDSQDKAALFRLGGHMNMALGVGRVDRVQDEVQDDLSQVIADANDYRQIGRHERS